MRYLKTFLTVLGAVTVLVLAANTIAGAATGQNFILGKTNKASTSTTLSRTTSGPAFRVITSNSQTAPFQVNGTALVSNLNADRVDGLHASQLRTAVHSFEISPTGFTGSNFSLQIPLASARYLVSYTATFDNVSGFTFCWFEQTTNPGALNQVQRIIGEDIYEGTNLAALNGHGVVAVDASTTVKLVCNTDGELAWSTTQPIQVTAQRIDAGNGGKVLTFD